MVTFYSGQDIPVFLLSIFAKGDKTNLTDSEVNVLRTVLRTLARRIPTEDPTMTKAGEELIKAATEALEITHGQADPESYRVTSLMRSTPA